MIEGLDDKEDPNDGWFDEQIPHQTISTVMLIIDDSDSRHISFQGTPFETIVNICPQPPPIDDMENCRDKNCIFMISVNTSQKENLVLIISDSHSNMILNVLAMNLLRSSLHNLIKINGIEIMFVCLVRHSM